MEIDEAMRRAVQKFYSGAGFDSIEKVSGPVKYNKDFFDGIEKSIKPKKKVEEVKESDDVE